MIESVTDVILKRFAICDISFHSQLFNLSCDINYLSLICWRNPNSDYFNLIKLLFSSNLSLPN